MGLVLISHDLGVIAETVDRVLVMYAGRAVESGPVREVFARMAHPYARGLFSAMPRIAPGLAHPRPQLPTIPASCPTCMTCRPPAPLPTAAHWSNRAAAPNSRPMPSSARRTRPNAGVRMPQ